MLPHGMTNLGEFNLTWLTGSTHMWERFGVSVTSLFENMDRAITRLYRAGPDGQTRNTMQCCFITVNFLLNTCKGQPIASHGEELWCLFCEFIVWFMFCCCHFSALLSRYFRPRYNGTRLCQIVTSLESVQCSFKRDSIFCISISILGEHKELDILHFYFHVWRKGLNPLYFHF